MKIYVGGFQRSGNTFLAEQMSARYGVEIPSENRYHHQVATHKDYVAGGQSFPFVIPVRDSRDAMVSHYIHSRKVYGNKEASQSMSDQIQNIKDLWEFTLSNKDKFFIAPFEKFTSNMEYFFNRLETKYPDLVQFADPNISPESVYEDLKKREVEKISQDVYLEIGHLPRDRSIFYDEAVKIIGSPEYSDEFDYLENIRQDLIKEY